MRQLTAVASLVLLASGCATYSWQRPGTPPAIAAQDHAECNALARDSARDIALIWRKGTGRAAEFRLLAQELKRLARHTSG